MPAGGLEEMNNPNRGDRGGSSGGDEGSGLQPTQLDLGDASTAGGSRSEFTKWHSGTTGNALGGNAGGGRFVSRKWHSGTTENALGGPDNGYTIIGNFDEFRQEDDRDESHSRGRIAQMIEDFGGEALGMQATTDTDYVVVGQPPEGMAERDLFELQLKEADTLELTQVSANDLMRRVGGSEVNTQGPYKSNDNDGADSGSMDEDDDDAISTGDTTGGRDSDNTKKDGDSSEEERSDGKRVYDEEYYQDSDGHQCRRDRPRSGGTGFRLSHGSIPHHMLARRRSVLLRSSCRPSFCCHCLVYP